jgi:serine protease Do
MSDFFRRFFGGIPEPFRGRGIGTGFIINSDGYILTNSHVVEAAQQIRVRLHDGTELAADVVGTDPPADIALLRIPSRGRRLPVAVLGDSDSLEIGDWVMAIGNPFGLDCTVTAGIVSAEERREINPDGRPGYYNYIQTDASINPGNSGGPLFNLRGEVVGINAAINAAGQGIGFAIPINMAKTLLPQLAQHGSVRRSWIGVVTQPVTRALAQSFRLPGQPRGALVTEVVPAGPGAHAGLRNGDIVVEFGGNAIERSDDLPWLASTAGVGARVPMVVYRNGSRIAVDINLGEMPGSTGRATPRPPVAPRRVGLGVTVRPSHPSLLPPGATGPAGVLVVEIDPAGTASEMGLERGDVVVEIDNQAVDSVPTFQRLVGAAGPGQVIRFRVIRNRRPFYFAFENGP